MRQQCDLLGHCGDLLWKQGSQPRGTTSRQINQKHNLAEYNKGLTKVLFRLCGVHLHSAPLSGQKLVEPVGQAAQCGRLQRTWRPLCSPSSPRGRDAAWGGSQRGRGWSFQSIGSKWKPRSTRLAAFYWLPRLVSLMWRNPEQAGKLSGLLLGLWQGGQIILSFLVWSTLLN